MFLSYFLIYIKNTKDIFYTFLFFDVLVYFCFFDSSCSSSIFCYFKALEITESDERESSEEGALIDVEAPDDEDICVD